MKTFTQSELNEILAKHKKWLNDEEGGERADLSSANLRYANLRSANLRSASLSHANLSSADLSHADLSSANLRYADLSSANLSSANLRYADLRSANLSYADLRSANLSSANLSSANLSSADLRSANLSSANLSSADLRFLHSADGKVLACMNAGKYQVVLSKDKIAIGCRFYTVEQWRDFDDNKISRMDVGALEWWMQWKKLVFMFHANVFSVQNDNEK